MTFRLSFINGGIPMKLFNVHYFPSITKRNRYMRARFRKATQEEGMKLSDGYMTEER